MTRKRVRDHDQDDDAVRAGEYVLGTLNGPERQHYAARLGVDTAARADVAAWEKRLGPLATAVKPVKPPKRLWTKIAARIAKPTTIPGTHTVRSADGAWTTIARGVAEKTLSIDRERGERTFLLRMAPGSRVAPHGHARDEECFVLEGRMVIGGVEFEAGDYHLAPKRTRHREITAPIGALILIRAAIAEHAA